MRNKNFAVLILTHGRPEKQKTLETLKKSGYTGQVYLVIDNADKTKSDYMKLYGNQVIVFDKKEIVKSFDIGDNFKDDRAIIYARNAAFEIANKLGLDYFIQLDDDYQYFSWRYDDQFQYIDNDLKIKNIEPVFDAMIDFHRASGCLAIALSQNGDFIGGRESAFAQKITLRRKCMNSFICSTARPFKFVGKINEDVNTVTSLGSIGKLFFTMTQASLKQTVTQKSSGGMTELYLDSGTYVKSFYSVMYSPSAVKVKMLGSANSRLHHEVRWSQATPKIIPEHYKKSKSDTKK